MYAAWFGDSKHWRKLLAPSSAQVTPNVYGMKTLVKDKDSIYVEPLWYCSVGTSSIKSNRGARGASWLWGKKASGISSELGGKKQSECMHKSRTKRNRMTRLIGYWPIDRVQCGFDLNHPTRDLGFVHDSCVEKIVEEILVRCFIAFASNDYFPKQKKMHILFQDFLATNCRILVILFCVVFCHAEILRSGAQPVK